MRFADAMATLACCPLRAGVTYVEVRMVGFWWCPMLASLLPGLRDVRTPLAVGYLWLLILWLWLADRVPRTKPADDGLVARLFDLQDILGATVALACLSFVAYVLGALLTIPIEASQIYLFLRRLGRYFSKDTQLYAREYDQHREEVLERFSGQGVNVTEAEMRALKRLADRERGFSRSVSDLRARLLVANQELYGEYDRLAAEAAFRVNLFPPSIALAILIARDLSVFWGIVVLVVAVILLLQGANRLGLSTAVLQRAVVAGVIEDQLSAKIREIVTSHQRNRSPA
jgi:hypothetical protein